MPENPAEGTTAFLTRRIGPLPLWAWAAAAGLAALSLRFVAQSKRPITTTTRGTAALSGTPSAPLAGGGGPVPFPAVRPAEREPMSTTSISRAEMFALFSELRNSIRDQTNSIRSAFESIRIPAPELVVLPTAAILPSPTTRATTPVVPLTQPIAAQPPPPQPTAPQVPTSNLGAAPTPTVAELQQAIATAIPGTTYVGSTPTSLPPSLLPYLAPGGPVVTTTPTIGAIGPTEISPPSSGTITPQNYVAQLPSGAFDIAPRPGSFDPANPVYSAQTGYWSGGVWHPY